MDVVLSGWGRGRCKAALIVGVSPIGFQGLMDYRSAASGLPIRKSADKLSVMLHLELAAEPHQMPRELPSGRGELNSSNLVAIARHPEC